MTLIDRYFEFNSDTVSPSTNHPFINMTVLGSDWQTFFNVFKFFISESPFSV